MQLDERQAPVAHAKSCRIGRATPLILAGIVVGERPADRVDPGMRGLGASAAAAVRPRLDLGRARSTRGPR